MLGLYPEIIGINDIRAGFLFVEVCPEIRGPVGKYWEFRDLYEVL